MIAATLIFSLLGIYVVVLLLCIIASIAFSIEDGGIDASEALVIFLAIVFWPITLIVVAFVILANNYEKIKRKVLGRYWTLRAKLSKEEDGSIWDR